MTTTTATKSTKTVTTMKMTMIIMVMMMAMAMVTMWFSLGAHSGTSKSRPGGFCLSGSELWMVIIMVMRMMLVIMYKNSVQYHDSKV